MSGPIRKERWKIGAGVLLILATIVWLAVSGIQESKTYYVTVPELRAMGEEAHGKRLRVGGDVAVGSIQRDGGRVSFTMVQESDTLPVLYVGTEPLPDTFRDRAQALADGAYGPDGVFVAKRIQAKCASKYEAQKPGVTHEAQEPGANGAAPAPPIEQGSRTY